MSDNDSINRGGVRREIMEFISHNKALVDEWAANCIDDIIDAIPAVPREMTAGEYIREYRRLCGFYFGKPAPDGGVYGCGACPCGLNGKKNCIFSPTRDESSIPIVEKFAREHPEEANDESV